MTRPSLRPIMLALALCFSCVSGCATTGKPTSGHERDSVSIPFVLTAQNNIVVKAKIDDAQELTLMFHSVSSDLTLTEEAVRRLGSVTFGDSTQVQSWGGASEARFSKGHRLQIGTLTRDGIAVWENKNSGDGTDGKFGFDYFGASVVEFDFDMGRIVVHDRLPKKAEAYEPIDIEDEDGELFVRGDCLFADKRYPNRFLIHSGYAGGILLDDAFVASSGIDGRIDITDTSRLTDSYGHTIEVKKGILPGFQLGQVRLSDVPVGFFSGALGSQNISVMGGDILKRFNLIFDITHKKLYVKRRDAA